MGPLEKAIWVSFRITLFLLVLGVMWVIGFTGKGYEGMATLFAWLIGIGQVIAWCSMAFLAITAVAYKVMPYVGRPREGDSDNK